MKESFVLFFEHFSSKFQISFKILKWKGERKLIKNKQDKWRMKNDCGWEDKLHNVKQFSSKELCW